MKTLTDLLNLVAQEIELNSRGYLVNFTFRIDTKYNRLSFEKEIPMFSKTGTEPTRIKKETILDYIDLKDEGEIQQAYWTIYNNGRTKND
tara:strand:+ start:1457 stop:1726 length:270 start_codon:yes stop_codon:yes gene_type:complete